MLLLVRLIHTSSGVIIWPVKVVQSESLFPTYLLQFASHVIAIVLYYGRLLLVVMVHYFTAFKVGVELRRREHTPFIDTVFF